MYRNQTDYVNNFPELSIVNQLNFRRSKKVIFTLDNFLDEVKYYNSFARLFIKNANTPKNNNPITLARGLPSTPVIQGEMLLE